jgi:hypothetical protein
MTGTPNIRMIPEITEIHVGLKLMQGEQ